MDGHFMALCRACRRLLAAMPSPLAAQSSKPALKAQLIGTWSFVRAEVTAADGAQVLCLSAGRPRAFSFSREDRQFAQIHVASAGLKIAANKRLTGTPEDLKAINQRSLSLFGTYTVDENNKPVTYQIAASTFPVWEGQSQARSIGRLTAEDVMNTNQSVAGGRFGLQP